MNDIRITPATPEGFKALASDQTPVAQLNGFMWVPYEAPCWHCEKSTSWIDDGFECHLHPGRCSEKKWDEYAWAEMFARLRERGLWK